jgi:hypothetical protein
LAARGYGSARITNDLDICYARDDDNLSRLAAALKDLGARLRGAPEDVPFLLDAKTLAAGDHFTFLTRAGGLDCLGSPAGARGGYDELERNATEMEIAGIPVMVASIDDLIRMKLTAGRDKDVSDASDLAAIRDERDRPASP